MAKSSPVIVEAEQPAPIPAPVIQHSKVVKIKNYVKANSVVLGALFLALVLAGFVVWQYQQNQTLKKQVSQLNGGSADSEIKELVAKVGRLIVLPVGEDPTVATVTDPSKLADQAFFATSEVGDKVLIYTNAKKAVLYRPKDNKIIAVAPVNIDGSGNIEPEVAGATTPITDKASVIIKVQNGSRTTGLARRVADEFKAAGYTSVSVSDTSSGISDTTSISYGQQYSNFISGIKQILGKDVPADIQIGATEVVIVLGTDFKLE